MMLVRLVVGKFCPLHKGHELLIETALAQCDAVRVISYSKPGFAKCEPDVRRRWLERRFPTARVLVLDDTTLAERPDAPEWPPDDADQLLHRRFVGYLCCDLLGERVDAVFTSEAYGPGFAEELQRYVRTRMRRGCSVRPEREHASLM
jgi:HTH-type transcriptional regulator, transcriptional repressor of NAD biosynthesis genes